MGGDRVMEHFILTVFAFFALAWIGLYMILVESYNNGEMLNKRIAGYSKISAYFILIPASFVVAIGLFSPQGIKAFIKGIKS